MIKANRNQLANVSNRFQTGTKKILTVCSAHCPYSSMWLVE